MGRPAVRDPAGRGRLSHRCVRPTKVEHNGQKVNSIAIKQDRCMYCGNCYTMCPALPSPTTKRRHRHHGGRKVSNRISMPKFSKVVVGYIPNEPPRWPTLTKTVKHIVEVYAANANKYERLGDWAERIGWESFFKLTGLKFTHHLIDDFRDPAYYTWRQSTQSSSLNWPSPPTVAKPTKLLPPLNHRRRQGNCHQLPQGQDVPSRREDQVLLQGLP